MRNKRRWASSTRGTIGGKISAFIILTNDRDDTGDGQEDRKERDGGSVLSDGTPGPKAPLSEEDGRQFAGSLAVPPPHPFLCSSTFLFLLRDFLRSPHPLSPLVLSLFLFLQLFGAVRPYFSEG